MAGFERKWSEQQRRAVTYACTLHGMRPRAACDLAAAGRLSADGAPVDAGTVDALEPYAPPVTTVREWVAAERRRTREFRRRRLEPSAILETVHGNLAELARVLDRETERVAERAKSRAPDPEHVRRLARSLREVGAAARELERSNAAPEPAAAEPASKSAPAAPGLLEHLAAQERQH